MLESFDPLRRVQHISRFIGQVVGEEKGPSLIFFGGIHGNEPAGVKALEHLFNTLEKNVFKIRGTLVGIRANLPALLQGKRFLDQDLNRLWTEEKMAEIKAKPSAEREREEMELLELEQLIGEILIAYEPPFYFIDFHTTSSKTLPFITINDALINRKFSQQFPLPIILGIEEFLEGPLLSRMNKLGYVSLGFESGQHVAESAVKNSIAFLWLTLVFAGALPKQDVLHFDSYYEELRSSANEDSNFYEVTYRHELRKRDDFSMLNGYTSFQKVTKGTFMAIQNRKKILAKENSILFMPLYQKQGAEGFFLIKKTPKWALKISTLFRKSKFDRLLCLLPGISWSSTTKESLLVNLSVARYFTKSFFHLLGYRNRQVDKTQIIMHNRERAAKNEMYRNTPWY
ncbi:MAG: succinylglutamate desuccinylase/aspartoacylase family protein [Maribacter sp.]|uniref:succinylglutamate desuccinylase/aspartoacylase family protein n=1 Tax=Maribacter sp. TaxID=1897614 RepID=UPI00329890E1